LAHHSCQGIFPKTGVISLSGGLKANSITFGFKVSPFVPFVNQDFEMDFYPLRTHGGYDMILKKQV
jgi:hypothetical protein